MDLTIYPLPVQAMCDFACRLFDGALSVVF